MFFLFSFCLCTEKSRAPLTPVCVPITFHLQSCATLLQDASLRWTKWVSLSPSDVLRCLPPTQSTKKQKITNKAAPVVSEHVAGFVASWSQLAAFVSDGCWDNESVRDSAWPPSWPSVNEQTSYWTCHRRPSEATANSHRSPFTWRTFRLAKKATDPKLINIYAARFLFGFRFFFSYIEHGLAAAGDSHRINYPLPCLPVCLVIGIPDKFEAHPYALYMWQPNIWLTAEIYQYLVLRVLIWIQTPCVCVCARGRDHHDAR